MKILNTQSVLINVIFYTPKPQTKFITGSPQFVCSFIRLFLPRISALQCGQRLPVRHHHLQHLCQLVALRALPLLLCNARAARPLQPRAQVLHGEVGHLPLLLAGWERHNRVSRNVTADGPMWRFLPIYDNVAVVADNDIYWYFVPSRWPREINDNKMEINVSC